MAPEQATVATLPSARDRLRDPGVQLWTLAGVCWVALLVAGHHHDVTLGGPGASVAGIAVSLLLVLGAWLEMTVAMMLPTTVPMVRMFQVVSARAPRTTAVRVAFLAGYLALWLVFAVAATGAAAGLRAWVVAGHAPWLVTRPGLLLAVVLAIAGVFQLTPLKDACLTQCRDPRAFLFAHYRRGVRGGWLLGWRHGISCLGCCWALMLIMIGTGLGNLLAMLVLTAVMVVEKTTRFGHRPVVPLGIGLLIAAAAVALYGDTLAGWGLYEPFVAPVGAHHH
ncbi:DUF2182 domain-containing protein [Mycobacterium sp. M1]|uniref:DUF2182 domain-containing protein n=1 Tax=Mycolicibacter acidiphilus TaxID=2835306 RepID=A0ABS5RJD4_9MYCO|nr:DUF2182 domain-containing protein [Mycolicibacter acidiphilus]MBS9534356.1 DUF2182 domain-containing protein [Mycolicibacter acidiphilus]